MKDANFMPYRCWQCKYGEYIFADSTWENGCDCETDEECEEMYEEDL